VALKKSKPYTPSRRGVLKADYSQLTGGPVPKSLVAAKRKRGGRNAQGRITAPRRGGGSRQKYRLVDFYRREQGLAEVTALQYDPNRSAFVALVRYEGTGKLSYILAPDGLKVGDMVEAGVDAPIKRGNALPMIKIPDGSLIHNIEVHPGARGKLVRAAGTFAQLMAKEGRRVIVRLPSGEVRYLPGECYATIGRLGNLDHENVKLGKAGATRHRGRRPRPRPTHLNPVDHPMGGGEGKSKTGRPPCSRTGIPAKGFRTRVKSKSRKYLVKDRRKK